IATSVERQFFDSAFDTTHLNFQFFSSTARIEYQGIVDIDRDNQATFGVETQESTFRADNFGVFAFFSPPRESGHDRLTGYYAHLQSTLFQQLTLAAGVRLDDDGQFGTHTSFKLNAAWQVPEWDMTVRANLGTAFKAPSLFQEFGPNSNPITQLSLKQRPDGRPALTRISGMSAFAPRSPTSIARPPISSISRTASRRATRQAVPFAWTPSAT